MDSFLLLSLSTPPILPSRFSCSFCEVCDKDDGESHVNVCWRSRLFLESGVGQRLGRMEKYQGSLCACINHENRAAERPQAVNRKEGSPELKADTYIHPDTQKTLKSTWEHLRTCWAYSCSVIHEAAHPNQDTSRCLCSGAASSGGVCRNLQLVVLNN